MTCLEFYYQRLPGIRHSSHSQVLLSGFWCCWTGKSSNNRVRPFNRVLTEKIHLGIFAWGGYTVFFNRKYSYC